ncbi:MAG: hypothetical protein QOH86_1613 [Sphingomonadales bacterium]|jgi:hypothetical protein|nr:hypothetical protein [Sphingomonadales bacterium]
MNKMIAAMTLFIALPSLPVASPADAMAMAPLHDPAELVIAGVRIGMTPAQVMSILRTAGYVRESQVTNQSWEEKLARELARTRGVPLMGSFREVPWHETYRKREERIEVYYRPLPSGPAVSGVDYGMGNAAMSEEAFRAAVRARYGVQSAGGSSEMIFCSVGEAVCSQLDFQDPKQLPYITVRPFGGAERSIELRSGAKAEKEYSAAFKVELARRAPAMKRPTF